MTRLARASDTPVFILCGGLGTRLRPTDARPKAIVPVSGLPFLYYLLHDLDEAGLRRVHLLLGTGAAAVMECLDRAAHRGASIEKRILRDVKIVPHVEPAPLGTGGALRHALAEAGEISLVMNGDSYVSVSYPALIEAHASLGAERAAGVTLLGVWADDRSDYGGLEIGADGRVAGFLEKGRRDAGWIYGGVSVAGRTALETLPPGTSSLEHDLFPRLARDGRAGVYTMRGFFRDIGTPERLHLAQGDFEPIYRRIASEPLE